MKLINKEKRKINNEIKHISKTLDDIWEYLRKSDTKISKILKNAGSIVGIMGIITIIDILKNWL